jgi:hypothetical protein
MSFNTKLEVPSADTPYSGDNNIEARFQIDPVGMQIVIDDLERAKQFKEQFGRDGVHLQFKGEPRLLRYESPIVVTPERTETVTDQDAVGQTVLEGAIALVAAGLTGGDSTVTQNAADIAGANASVRSYTKTQTVPAQTRAGVRFYFEVEVTSITVCDVKGAPIPGIKVQLPARAPEPNPAEQYRKAAEQGLAAAQNELGLCYAKGLGVEQDLREAVKWFRKAAEQGHADGQYDLAYCYDSGKGVEMDEQEAVKWYRKAAEQGHADAEKALKVLAQP